MGARQQRGRAAAGRPRPRRGVGRGRLLIAGVALVAAVAAGVVVLSGGGAGGGAGNRATRDDFSLPRLDGAGQVQLADLRGHPVVVDLFASWCTACDGELPGFARTAAAAGSRVTFVGIDSLETGDGLGMARRDGIAGFRLARDVGTSGGAYHDAIGGVGMPVTAFYDATGRLVEVSQGALTEDRLRAELQRLFGITV